MGVLARQAADERDDRQGQPMAPPLPGPIVTRFFGVMRKSGPFARKVFSMRAG
jgi:hypothetical protein